MTFLVANNEPFQTVNDSISFYSQSPITLEYSVDGVNYVQVPISTTFPDNIVVKCKEGTYFRLGGITGKILVNN